MTQKPQNPAGPKSPMEERPGQTSAMRVMSMIALIFSIILTSVIILFECVEMLFTCNANCSIKFEISAGLIILLYVSAAFAPKALQKFAENNLSKFLNKLEQDKPKEDT